MFTWYVVCASLLLGHGVWFFALRSSHGDQWRTRMLMGQVVLEALIVALALLLATTPRNAIRLPRGRSEILVIAGNLLLLLGAYFVASSAPTAGTAARSVGAVAVALAMLWLLRARDKSAWFAALWAWNPLVIGAAALYRH